MRICNNPPPGWVCSRPEGHDGPCATTSILGIYTSDLALSRPSGEVSVTFTGFDTIAQAREFANWYEHIGEQGSDVWLEENAGLSSANVARGVPWVETADNIIVPLDIVYREVRRGESTH